MSNAKSVRLLFSSHLLTPPLRTKQCSTPSPLLCQFRPLQHSNYTSEYTDRIRRPSQAAGRISAAPSSKSGAAFSSVACTERASVAWCMPRLENHNRSSAASRSSTNQLGMDSPPKGKEPSLLSLAVANRATYFPRFSLTHSFPPSFLPSFLLSSFPFCSFVLHGAYHVGHKERIRFS